MVKIESDGGSFYFIFFKTKSGVAVEMTKVSNHINW